MLSPKVVDDHHITLLPHSVHRQGLRYLHNSSHTLCWQRVAREAEAHALGSQVPLIVPACVDCNKGVEPGLLASVTRVCAKGGQRACGCAKGAIRKPGPLLNPCCSH